MKQLTAFEGKRVGNEEKVILDLTFKRVVSIWWSMAWRSVAWSILVALVFGALIGGTAYLFRRPDWVNTFLMPLLLLSSTLMSIWITKTALLKKRKEFTIILLKNSG